MAKKILGYTSYYIKYTLYCILLYLIYLLNSIYIYIINYIDDLLNILLNKDLIILSYIIFSIPLVMSSSLLDYVSFKDNNIDSADDIKLQKIKIILKEAVIQSKITQKFLTPFMFILNKYRNKGC